MRFCAAVCASVGCAFGSDSVSEIERIQDVEIVEDGWESEREFVDHITQLFKDRGYETVRESASPYGVLDLMAYVRVGMLQRTQLQIVEAKMNAKAGPVAHALGQLLLYGAAWPSAQLWFACPERPAPYLLEAMERYGVRLLKWHDSSHLPIARAGQL